MNDIRERLQDTARAVEVTLPPGTGFIVMAFDFGDGGRLEYVSNADRKDVVKCLKEFIAMSKPINDIWKDPMVKAALKEGRSADDIQVMDCPKCGRYGYYNQGSHFSCRFCKLTWYCLSEEEDRPEGALRCLRIHEHMVSLADTVTVTTDGYDNRTLP